jgi:hypothetical protein
MVMGRRGREWKEEREREDGETDGGGLWLNCSLVISDGGPCNDHACTGPLLCIVNWIRGLMQFESSICLNCLSPQFALVDYHLISEA